MKYLGYGLLASLLAFALMRLHIWFVNRQK